jgi:DHA3 family macrolide efflux protein-like MFS transporter
MTELVPWRRTYTILFSGQFIALNGLAAAMFSLGVYIYHLTGSATGFGLDLALPILPFIAASLVAGPLVDRWGQRRALLVANAYGITNLLLLTVLQATDTIPGGRVRLFLFLAAAGKALHLAAFDAAVPFAVPKTKLGKANGLRMFLTAVGAVTGSVIAGPVLAALGFYGVIAMGLACFAVGIVSLFAAPFPGVQRDRYPNASWARLPAEVLQAWRYVVNRPGLIALLVVFAVVNFGIGAAELLTTQLTLSFGSQAALNTVLLSAALGLVVGTALMTFWGRPRRRSVGVFGFSLLFGAAMILAAPRPSVPLLSVAAFLFLGSTPVIIGTIQTLWQLKVEPHMLGRVAALADLFTDVPYSIGNILSGFAAGLVFIPLVGTDHVRSPAVAAVIGNGAGRGYAAALMAIGVLIVIYVLLAYRYPRLRHLERNLPDATPADVTASIAEPAMRGIAEPVSERAGDPVAESNPAEPYRR